MRHKHNWVRIPCPCCDMDELEQCECGSVRRIPIEGHWCGLDYLRQIPPFLIGGKKVVFGDTFPSREEAI